MKQAKEKIYNMDHSLLSWQGHQHNIHTAQAQMAKSIIPYNNFPVTAIQGDGQ